MSRMVLVCGLVFVMLLAGFIPAQPAAAQTTSTMCDEAVEAALSRLGYPYQWGAKGRYAFDCSGLTYWAYLQAGVDIGVSTYQQVTLGVPNNCTLANLNGAATTCWQRGDLIFLAYGNNQQHVSIYVGNGLFADAYNSSTGVFLHRVETDSFYQSHFWQGRRLISNCTGSSNGPTPPQNPPPAPGNPGGNPRPPSFTPPASGTTAPLRPGEPTPPPAIFPRFEDMPDLVQYVSYGIAQCSGPQGNRLNLRTQQPAVNVLDPASVSAWLSWQINNGFLTLTCWLAHFTQQVVNGALVAYNALLALLNTIWRLLLFVWLNFRGLVLWGWYGLELLRSWWFDTQDFFAVFAQGFADGLAQVLNLLAQFVQAVGRLFLAGVGVLGWIGGFLLDLIAQILRTVGWSGAGNSVPVSQATPGPLQGTSNIYCAVRGAFDGIIESEIGWLVRLLHVLAYIGFVFWFSRFISVSKAE